MAALFECVVEVLPPTPGVRVSSGSSGAFRFFFREVFHVWGKVTDM